MKNFLFAIFFCAQVISSETIDVRLTNMKAYGSCEGKITESESGENTLIAFDHLVARRADKEPFIKCRLSAELEIPSGFQIAPNNLVKAIVVGNFSKVGDQIGGRLNISIGGEKNGDLKMDPACHIDEPHQIELQAALPSTKSLDGSKLSVNFIIEAMLNFRLDSESSVNAKLESLSIPPIKLIKFEKNP